MTDSPRKVHDVPETAATLPRHADALPADGTRAKRPWVAPSFEEVGYSETQASANPGATYDAPIYST